ncbi:MAG: F0F1 ATP synthase subunit B [Pseudomonadota bacterium]
MEINATLIGQAISFGLFVWLTMKFIWPPLVKVLDERQQLIAEGIAVGEQNQQLLKNSEFKVSEILNEARQRASTIIRESELRATKIVDDARQKAEQEGQRLIQSAQYEIQKEANQARQVLKDQLSDLVVLGTEKILKREVNVSAHQDVIEELRKKV